MVRGNEITQADRYIFILIISIWSILGCAYSIVSNHVYQRAYDKLFDRGVNGVSVILCAGSLVIGRDLPTGCYELSICKVIYASAAIGVVIWAGFMFLAVYKPTVRV